MTLPPRAFKPFKHSLDVGSDHWRTGVQWVVGDTVTLRVHVESGIVRDFVVARELVPTVTLGAPVAVRLVGASALSYTIAEIRGAVWGASGPGSNEAGAVQRGEFHLPVLPPGVDPEFRELHEWCK